MATSLVTSSCNPRYHIGCNRWPACTLPNLYQGYGYWMKRGRNPSAGHQLMMCLPFLCVCLSLVYLYVCKHVSNVLLYTCQISAYAMLHAGIPIPLHGHLCTHTTYPSTKEFHPIRFHIHQIVLYYVSCSCLCSICLMYMVLVERVSSSGS